MYASAQERAASAAAAFVVVLLILLAFITGLKVAVVARDIPVLVSIFLDRPKPPPPPKPPSPPAPSPAKTAAKGSPAPQNLKNRATPVVAPPPRLPPLILPPPVVVATQAGTGRAAANGASDRAGPGQGAGGLGNGNGGGGDDAAGDGGVETDPEQTHGHLSFSDMPRDLLAPGQQTQVAVKYFVDVDGRVRDCHVSQSSGYAVLDALTCRLIVQRYRFRPGRDAAGRPVRAMVEDICHWAVDPGKRD